MAQIEERGTQPPIVHEPVVTLVGRTEFAKPPQIEWETDAERPGEALIELAGRACYRSYHNPAGRSNEEYIHNLMGMGHLSVIEHSFAAFHMIGVSRSFTHELVRHRHLSFSQRSQRYVDERDEPVVEPEAIAADPELHRLFVEATAGAREAYAEIVERLDQSFSAVESKTDRRKLARQCARAVLPNAMQTEIVVSGNYRAWRHFLMLRCSPHAEAEIRAVAMQVLDILRDEAPVVFGDYRELTAPDGSRAAEPTLAPE